MDRIAYVLVSKAGGADGRDSTAIGGKDVIAFFSEDEAKKSPLFNSCTLEKRVVEMDKAHKEAVAKLSATDRLVLGIISSQKPNFSTACG